MGAEKGRLGPSPSSAMARGEPREGSGRQASRDPCRSSSSQREHTSEDTPASQVPYDLIPSGKTSQGQQQPRIPKAKDPRKSQSKIFVPTDERNDYRRPKPGECEERFAGLRASQASEMSRPSQVRGTGDTTGSKCLQLLLEKGHSSHFRKEMQHFLEHLDPSQKDKGLEDLPPKGEPASATAQSPGPVTSSVKDGGAGEAQMIATSVGQILAETLRLHQGLCGSEKWQHKEFQAPGSGHSRYQGAFSSPEQRRVMTNTVYSHKATSGVHGCPNKSREPGSPARPSQHGPNVAGASEFPKVGTFSLCKWLLPPIFIVSQNTSFLTRGGSLCLCPAGWKGRALGLLFLSACFGFQKGCGHGERLAAAWHTHPHPHSLIAP
uniref:Uncharacterized protein n=1 Tax=Equus asinus TaxID=9793 RepID=A0A9L0IEI0_EQUAS